MAADAEAAVIDRRSLLQLRPVATDAAEPPEVGLCTAKECEDEGEDSSKGKDGKKNKTGAKAKDKAKDKGAAAAAADPGERPWRRSGQGRSSPEGSPEGSPELGPQSDAKNAAPWRKSPPESPDEMLLEPSDPGSNDDGGAEQAGTFEVTLSGAADLTDAIASGSGAQKAGAAEDGQPQAGDDDEEAFVAKDEGGADSQEWKGGWSGGGGKWKQGSKEDAPVLKADTVVAATPAPNLLSLAGTWIDSLGNMIQVPLGMPMAWFTGQSGSSQREFSLDNWSRLWCGNGVLHQVGYSGGPLAQDMPPSHLSWRTTSWKFSVWERIASPPVPTGPPAGSEGAGGSRKKAGGGKGGKKGREGESRGKGKGSRENRPEREAPPPPKPELPKLGDFLSFPELGGDKKNAKSKS